MPDVNELPSWTSTLTICFPEKAHPCNLAEFSIYAGMSPSPSSMEKLLDGSLKNDSNTQKFGLHLGVGREGKELAASISLSVPLRVVINVPSLSTASSCQVHQSGVPRGCQRHLQHRHLVSAARGEFSLRRSTSRAQPMVFAGISSSRDTSLPLRWILSQSMPCPITKKRQRPT